MVSPPKEREKEYAGSYVTNSGQLYQTMKEVERSGLVHCIHAECDSTVSCLTEEMRLEKRKDPTGTTMILGRISLKLKPCLTPCCLLK